MERYSVSLGIQSEWAKIQTRKNSVFGHFSRSVCMSKIDDKSTSNPVDTYLLKGNNRSTATTFVGVGHVSL